jgi:hypothetical protein
MVVKTLLLPVENSSPSFQDVQKAVVQIEAEGTFLDPQFGLQVNSAGRGSGFIIDPEGYAVTNNHVVTGAALVKVWVNGETTPRNAKVVAYSECNDLALIKIDGSDFSYLEWYDGEITTGMEVYLAGYPLASRSFHSPKELSVRPIHPETLPGPPSKAAYWVTMRLANPAIQADRWSPRMGKWSAFTLPAAQASINISLSAKQPLKKSFQL